MMPAIRGHLRNMATKTKGKPAPTNTPSLTDKPWWKSTWLKVSAGIAALAVLLTNVNSILSNARELPGEWGKTANQFSSWYHEDAAWNGRWTNNPEGYVDEADMNLSGDEVEIRLSVENGKIDGSIATKGICDRLPFVDFVLLRGDVSGGKTAHVVAWDIFGGHAADIAKLKLVRNGIMMKVTLEEGPNQLFPLEAEIALDPNLDRKKIFEPTGQGEEFCTGKAQHSINAVPEVVKKL
jgi:hypothetical protein